MNIELGDAYPYSVESIVAIKISNHKTSIWIESEMSIDEIEDLECQLTDMILELSNYRKLMQKEN